METGIADRGPIYIWAIRKKFQARIARFDRQKDVSLLEFFR
jgi:hypothetical protein